MATMSSDDADALASSHPRMSPPAPGALCLLHGLKARPDLNDAFVRVKAYHEESGRYECMCLNESLNNETVRARPANVQVYGAERLADEICTLAQNSLAEENSLDSKGTSFRELYALCDEGMLCLDDVWDAAERNEYCGSIADLLVALIEKETNQLTTYYNDTNAHKKGGLKLVGSMLLTTWCSVLHDGFSGNVFTNGNKGFNRMHARRTAEFFRVGGLHATLRCARAALRLCDPADLEASTDSVPAGVMCRLVFESHRSLKLACCVKDAVKALVEAGHLDTPGQLSEVTWWLNADERLDDDGSANGLEGTVNNTVACLVIHLSKMGRSDLANKLRPPEGSTNALMFDAMAMPFAEVMCEKGRNANAEENARIMKRFYSSGLLDGMPEPRLGMR